jgi:hypothetical protein
VGYCEHGTLFIDSVKQRISFQVINLQFLEENFTTNLVQAA